MIYSTIADHNSSKRSINPSALNFLLNFRVSRRKSSVLHFTAFIAPLINALHSLSIPPLPGHLAHTDQTGTPGSKIKLCFENILNILISVFHFAVPFNSTFSPFLLLRSGPTIWSHYFCCTFWVEFFFSLFRSCFHSRQPHGQHQLLAGTLSEGALLQDGQGVRVFSRQCQKVSNHFFETTSKKLLQFEL